MLSGIKIMKQRRSLILFLILIVVTLILAGCTGGKDLSVNSEKSGSSNKTKTSSSQRPPFLVKEQEYVLEYFATPDGKNLVPVTILINSTKEAAKIAVEKLLAGPENDFSSPIIPEGTKLKEMYLQENILFVDLTPEILKIPGDKAQQAVDALLFTLTEFKSVTDVQILVNGQKVQTLGSVDIGQPLKRPDSINRYGNPGNSSAKIFFSDSNAMYLVPVTMTVNSKNPPLSALERLIKGPPGESGLLPTVWKGTRVKNFNITDGVATVDFNAQVLGYGGGSTAETALLNSVLFTLTQFPEIKSVQFLIEGKKMEYLPEGTDISSPLPAPQKLNFNG